MELRALGRTGVRVSELALGTMMLGPWGNPDRDEGIRMIHRALDAGINLIDTADVYSRGVSEETVGRAIRGRRDEAVLATKVNGPMGEGPNQRGNSRLWIHRAVEDSLRRLGTDRIDLYQLHRPDPHTDIEETLSALDDLVRQGKIRYAGSSTFPGWQLVEAHWASERLGLVRLASEQPPYSILVRHAEDEIFPVTQRYGMGAIVWSPLAGGWLTGKYRRGDPFPEGSRGARSTDKRTRVRERFDLSREGTRRKLDAVEELRVIADKAGLSMTHLAIAFTLAHPAVTSAIIGPKTEDQLDDLLAAAAVRLDDEVLDAIDLVVAPGTTLDDVDRGWDPPWMEPAARRGGREPDTPAS
ncbi:MAG: aldo/keto reductase [Actinomycetota bacterium]|nr:aldo/keto reductase [Actinomycetota bacterium]